MSSTREQELERELDAVRQELQMTQTHLVTAARYAANAGLAYTLTHEINNALTPILGNAQILALLHAQDTETQERTGQIIANARRIAGWNGTIRQLTSESRREPVEYSLNGLAREVFAFFAERFERFGIVTHLELDAALPALRGNPGQIQQMLMLLAQNAIEAMPQGGRILLQTVYDPAEPQVIATLTYSALGMALVGAEHLFEPLVSMKPETIQTAQGWGFFTIQQTVRAQAGFLEISRAAADGTQSVTVQLRLPLQSKVVT